MRVLMLSTDASIFKPGSESHGRMKDYGTLADRLDIIVCTTGFLMRELVISDTARAIPTNSRSKLWYVRDVLRAAKRKVLGDVDVVTSQDPFETGLAGWLLSRRLRAKLQLQLHTDFLSPYFSRASFKNFIRVRIAKWLLPKADSIRVVSERIKKSLIGLGLSEEKIVVLPIFVDVEKIQAEPITVDLHKKYPQFDFIILMASRLEPEKNIHIAIDAMKDVVKKDPKIGLVVVGEGSLKEELEEQVSKDGLDRNVIFEGWVNNVSSYYKTTDAFLSASKYEGYGRGVVMTGAASTPVMTTDVGLVGEILNQDNSLIIPVNDTQKIVESIFKLRSDPHLVKKLGSRAREAVRSLGTKKEYLEKYKQSWEM